MHVAAFVTFGHAPPPAAGEARRTDDIAVDEFVLPVETPIANPASTGDGPAPWPVHKHPNPALPDHGAPVRAPVAVAASEPSAHSSAPADASAAAPAPARFTLIIGRTPMPQGEAGAQTAAAEVARGSDATPLSESDVSAPARVVGAITPSYPPGARADGVEADVVVAVVVTTEGKVSDARVERRAGFGFDEAAVAAVRAARFVPARREGRTVAVRMRLAYSFRLH
jgi:protein TonB